MPGLTILHGCRTLQLTRGYNTLIDETDFADVGRYKWHFRGQPGNGYATRGIQIGKCKQKCVRLHRVLMDAPCDRKVDHKNGDAFDNRRSNLRIVTQKQNARNIRKAIGISRFKGRQFQHPEATLAIDHPHGQRPPLPGEFQDPGRGGAGL
jgi:hypothetical protein